MAVAKNPGAGQGRGGGRPKREGEVEAVRLRLSPEAVELLRSGAQARGVSTWRMAEELILSSLGSPGGGEAARSAPLETLPKVVQEIAREAGEFLVEAENSRTGARLIRKAWAQALLMARHEMGRVRVSLPMEGG